MTATQGLLDVVLLNPELKEESRYDLQQASAELMRLSRLFERYYRASSVSGRDIEFFCLEALLLAATTASCKEQPPWFFPNSLLSRMSIYLTS